MSLTARLWKGAGLLTLGGVLLSGVVARRRRWATAGLAIQRPGQASTRPRGHFHGPDLLPESPSARPRQAEAAQGLKESKAQQTESCRVALQDGARPRSGQPVTPPSPPAAGQPAAAGSHATIEESDREENVQRQQLTNDVEQRFQSARGLVTAGQPEAALDNLRRAQMGVRSATNVPEDRSQDPRPPHPGPDCRHGQRRGTHRAANAPSGCAFDGRRRAAGPGRHRVLHATRKPSTR